MIKFHTIDCTKAIDYFGKHMCTPHSYQPLDNSATDPAKLLVPKTKPGFATGRL